MRRIDAARLSRRPQNLSAGRAARTRGPRRRRTVRLTRARSGYIKNSKERPKGAWRRTHIAGCSAFLPSLI